MKRISCLLAFVAALGLTQSNAQEIKAGGYAFETAGKWTDVSSGKPMRAAELKFDASGDDDPVAVFFYFGAGQGGDVDANVARWKGQFEGGPKNEERQDLEDGKILLILSGTYLESMGGPFAGPKTPKENYRMLAAIVPGEDGAVFIKLTAPAAVANQAQDAFIALVKSAKKL